MSWIVVDDAGRIVAKGEDKNTGHAAAEQLGGQLVDDVEKRGLLLGLGGRVRGWTKPRREVRTKSGARVNIR